MEQPVIIHSLVMVLTMMLGVIGQQLLVVKIMVQLAYHHSSAQVKQMKQLVIIQELLLVT